MAVEPYSVRRNLGLFLPLYLPGFLFAFSHSLLTPVLPLYTQSFEVSYATVGVVLAGESIGMLLGDVPAGMLMRSLGQKASMAIGLILTGLSTAAIFWAPSILAILLMRILAGLGSALFNVSRHYFLVEMTPLESRGRIISVFGGMYRAGRLLGPLIGGSVALWFGLRSSFLAFGVACLLALVIVIFFLPHVEVERRDGSDSLRSAAADYGSMIQQMAPRLFAAGPGFLFMQLTRSGPAVIIPLYAANVLGLDVQTIGWIMSISAILDMILFYPSGVLMDRWGRKYAIVSSCLLQAIGLGMIPFTGSAAALTLAGLTWGFGNGLGSGVMLTLGSDLAPRQGRSEFLGTWSLIGDLGSTSGPLVIGGLAEAISLSGTAWVTAAAGLIAVFIFSAFVPETLRSPH